ncbi:MAG: hypothetical protein H5U05_03450 [Candidatus Aminicenantes bacterium]|nr:hypothetical protein [Candidatus Aminicenantes bacterium]
MSKNKKIAGLRKNVDFLNPDDGANWPPDRNVKKNSWGWVPGCTSFPRLKKLLTMIISA